MTDTFIQFARDFGFNAALVLALGWFVHWLLIQHKNERQEWREVIERQHHEIIDAKKESNRVSEKANDNITSLEKAVLELIGKMSQSR